MPVSRRTGNLWPGTAPRAVEERGSDSESCPWKGEKEQLSLLNARPGGGEGEGVHRWVGEQADGTGCGVYSDSDGRRNRRRRGSTSSGSSSNAASRASEEYSSSTVNIWNTESESDLEVGRANESQVDERKAWEGEGVNIGMEIERTERPSNKAAQGSFYPPEILLEILRFYRVLVQLQKTTLRHLVDCRLVSRSWKPVVEEVAFRYLRVEHADHWVKIRECLDGQPELFTLVKECEILCPLPKVSNTFDECAWIASTMPNLRRLCIHHLDSDHNNPASLFSSFPCVTEVSVVGMLSRRQLLDYAGFSNFCEDDENLLDQFKRYTRFPAVVPFISGLNALTSLELHDFEFDLPRNGCQDFPVALSRIVLHNCSDNRDTVNQAFRRSRSTLRHFATFNPSWSQRPKFPVFVDAQTPWTHIGLIHNSRHRPSYFPEVKTLCCTLAEISTSTQNLGNASLDEVQRVILTSSGYDPPFSASVRLTWPSLRWLEMDVFRFDNASSHLFFDTFNGVLPNINVLCLSSYRRIPKELPTVFPNLRALLLTNIIGLGGSLELISGEVAWLVPSLQIISLQRFDNFGSWIYDCFMDVFTSSRALNLQMIVLPPHEHQNMPDDFLVECERRRVDITTENIYFEEWARSIMK